VATLGLAIWADITIDVPIRHGMVSNTIFYLKVFNFLKSICCLGIIGISNNKIS